MDGESMAGEINGWGNRWLENRWMGKSMTGVFNGWGHQCLKKSVDWELSGLGNQWMENSIDLYSDTNKYCDRLFVN